MAAQQHAKANGKTLVSHVLLDEGVMSGRVREPTYAREFLVYPEAGGKFKKGRDTVDSETGDLVPWSALKHLDVCRPGVNLVVDPKDLDTHKRTGKMVVLPESVAVVENCVQQDGNGGKADEKTKIPVAVSPELWEKLSDDKRRWPYRIAGQGVRPLVRFYGPYSKVVLAVFQPHVVLGVAFEEAREAAAQKAATSQPHVPSSSLVLTRESADKLIIQGTSERVDAVVKLIAQLGGQYSPTFYPFHFYS